VAIALPVGLIAGYRGGIIEAIAMRLVDAFLALPFVLMALAVVAALGSGFGNIILVIVLQLGVVTSISVFNPVLAAYRLEHTASDRISRTLSAWSVSSNATIAALTALWGVLASFTGPRIAIGAAGALLLATPLALPRRERVIQAAQPEPELARP